VNLTSYVLEQALRRLSLPDSSLKQFRIASQLSDVGGNGFPRELFQLSAPLVVRGLLNFATLQMNQDWVYPYWVHRQLNPKDPSFIPRSQNPLLLNVTHRNWTTLGSPNGVHEAIVDPRGLATPLPREWSLDVWVVLNGSIIFPSLLEHVDQEFCRTAPRLTTVARKDEIELRVEHFVDPTNRDIDVLFQRARVKNIASSSVSGTLCVAIRPFNPEGVAPIHSIEFRQNRFAYVDKVLGVALAKPPDWVLTSNASQGDTASLLRALGEGASTRARTSIECRRGLANAIAAYRFELEPGSEFFVDCSVALNPEKTLRTHAIKQTWRVSFEKRKERHGAHWLRELAQGATVQIADEQLQKMFEACRLTLLELQDDEFISPGPFLYHHFWYRDAAPMVRALDLLGFQKRAQQVIDGFKIHLRADGFFRGPEGEWDSNGTVLWTVYQHYTLTRSRSWLQAWYPELQRGARWITAMRKKTTGDSGEIQGLMPPSLSAEHLGTVDQYFWDTFWSLAGLHSLESICAALGRTDDRNRASVEAASLEQAVRSTLARVSERLGCDLIPATPTREFNESAIGSVASVYPLHILADLPHPANTVRAIDRTYVNEHGFYHPFIHSGYNPYLTLQLAHSYLWMGESRRAWEIAETIFNQTQSPYSLPEAIHPTSGGGSMGDGHHGWAAAEIVLFLRDCLVRERDGSLVFFGSGSRRIVERGVNVRMENLPTDFGLVSASLTFESDHRCVLQFENDFFEENRPEALEILLPFASRTVTASSPRESVTAESHNDRSAIRCSSTVKTLFIEL